MNRDRFKGLLKSLTVAAASFVAIGMTLTGFLEAPDAHDLWPHLASTFEVAQTIQAGVPWPRWMPDLCGGYGAPNPLFYAPLSYQLSGRLANLGLGAAEGLRAAASLAMVVSFAGMYVWVRRSWGRAAGLLAAVLYLLAPYHLVDLYIRLAYPELIGLALAPWLFWLAQRAVEEGRGERWVAVLLAILALAHNLSALLFGAFLIGYVACLALERQHRAGALNVLFNLPLAAGLAAFFWMPALLEVHLVRLPLDSTVQTGWSHNLLKPGHLLKDHWPGNRDHLPVYPGRVHLAIGLLGLASACALARRREPGARGWVAFGGLSLLALGMTVEASAPLWRALPIKVLQFPWRFLGPAAMGLAWIAPLALWPLRTRRAVHTMVAAVLCLAVLVACYRLTRPTNWRIMDVGTTMLRQSFYTLSFEKHFVPAAAVQVPRCDPPAVQVTDGQGEVELLEQGPEHLRARILARTVVRADVRRMWFEGWTAQLDGSEIPVAVDEGTGGMWVQVPPGEHVLALWFGWNDLRRNAALISLATLVLMLLPAEGGGIRRELRLTVEPVAWLVLVGAAIAILWPVARRALPFGPDHHAHRARVALSRRDHEGALLELAQVDPAGPHGAWAAEQLAWHRTHGLTARWFADTVFGLEMPRSVEHVVLHQSSMTPDNNLERGASSMALSATIDIPVDGKYAFRVESGMRGTLVIDDRVVVRELKKNEGFTADGEVELTRGPHELAIALRPGPGAITYRFWWRPPGASGWLLLPVSRLKPASPSWLDPLLKRMRVMN